MYIFELHGFKFKLDVSDWAPNTDADKQVAIERLSDSLEKLPGSVVAKAHAEMIKDQADGANQYDILNGSAPESAEYSAIKDCERDAARSVFDTWSRWPQSGHNFYFYAAL